MQKISIKLDLIGTAISGDVKSYKIVL